jgi:hypothetical protein
MPTCVSPPHDVTWPRVMRGLSRIVLLAVIGCGGPDPAPPRPPPPIPERSEVLVARASCLATTPAIETQLARAGSHVQIGERTYAVAWRGAGEPEQVIVSLDANGALEVTPIPVPYADPFALGGDARQLVIISVPLRGTGSILRVAIGPDGELTPGSPSPLPEVVWGWPQRIRVDGARAFLDHNVATVDQTMGARARFTIDLSAPRVTSRVDDVHEETCWANGCVERDGNTFTLGSERLAIELASTCPAWYTFERDGDLFFVAPGDPWRAVRAGRTSLREVPIAPSLAPVPGCGNALYPFPTEGVIAGFQQSRTLMRFDGRMFGVEEPLPPTPHLQTARVVHPDGVIEVLWTAGHGMMHSPSDREIRRYFHHWSFEGGEATLLRREDDAWTVAERMPLALSNAEGTFSNGYGVTVLRNGLHVAILLAPESSGDPAYLQPFLAPCAH